MLPDDPVLRGRLFHAARALLGWTQARVAGEAGVSTAAVAAVEIGRRGSRAPAVPPIVGALERAGVRLAAGSTDEASCAVHVVHRLVRGSFASCRPGMTTPRDELLSAIRRALRQVPPGVWRDLGKPRLPGDGLPETIAAEAILAHLELAGFEIRQQPPPAGPGPSVPPR